MMRQLKRLIAKIFNMDIFELFIGNNYYKTLIGRKLSNQAGLVIPSETDYGVVQLMFAGYEDRYVLAGVINILNDKNDEKVRNIKSHGVCQ